MGAVSVADQPADLLDQARPFQQLGRQRLGGGVLRGKEMQPAASVRGDDSGQELQVVIDDAGMDRLGGDVDHLRARLPQKQQQEQEPLLVRLHLGAREDRGVERHRGDDDDRLRVLAHCLDGLPERDELGLEAVEARLGLAGRNPQVAGAHVVGAGQAHERCGCAAARSRRRATVARPTASFSCA